MTEVAELGTFNGVLEIKAYGETQYTDITSYLESIRIHRRINSASQATIRLFDANKVISTLLSPNTEVRFRSGFGNASSDYQFWGYIPSNKDYTNKVSIAGKNRTYTDQQSIDRFGVSHKVIQPASEDYPDTADVKISSEQEDMLKAQKFTIENNDPTYPSKSDHVSLEITCYDYVNKLEREQIYYDDISNIDNMEIFAGMSIILEGLEGSPLRFGGGGSDPERFIGDSTTDWKSKKSYIDDLVKKLDVDDTLNKEILKYFYYQSNHGGPTFIIKKYNSTLVNPIVIKSISESEILEFSRSRYKVNVSLIDGFWLNLGDVVYIPTDEYDLRKYYFIPEILYDFSINSANISLVLDKPITLR